MEQNGQQGGQELGELARGISLTGERVENVVPLMCEIMMTKARDTSVSRSGSERR